GAGQLDVERGAGGERLLELLEDVLGQPLALGGDREDVVPEDGCAGFGEIGRAESAAVDAPLCSHDVVLPGSRHWQVWSSCKGARPRVGRGRPGNLIPMSKGPTARFAAAEQRKCGELRARPDG